MRRATKNGVKHFGVVVPMVTPVTSDGQLDEPAVDRLIEFILAGEVEGIFVLGTTGEGLSVPEPSRKRMVERTVARVRGRARVYAGLDGAHADEIQTANDYLKAGADTVVAKPRSSCPRDQLVTGFRSLLDGLDGPLILYNIPTTTNVSIPLDTVEELSKHPNVEGIKDSENDPARLVELMHRFGQRDGFSVFVGVGALMAQGLRLGADGIVPSVGNLIPEVCHQLCLSARKGDWAQVDQLAARMSAVAALYQNGRTLGQSLAALKAALSCRGLCAPNVLPPLLPNSASEVEALRGQMIQLNLVG